MKQLTRLHSHCTHNRIKIKESRMVGCCYCCRIYPATEVQRFTGKGTGICPYCSIDCLLPDRCVRLTVPLLYAMGEKWLSPSK